MAPLKAFGPYDLIERIGVGALGEVHRAVRRDTGEVVAIKRLMPSAAEEGELEEMLHGEAQLLRALDHSGIAKVVDVGQVGGTHYIACEFVDGRDLRAIQERALRAGQLLPLDVALAVVRAIADALAHVHGRKSAQGRPLGLVHRDVSPGNIMVSFTGTVKLVDFGIARADGRVPRTGAGQVKGTLGYLSPEQASGGRVDGRTDVFSLGVCLWEVATGHRLFDAPHPLDAARRILRGDVPSPRARAPRVSEDLERIILKALAQLLDQRYPTAEDLQAELSALAHAEGLLTDPTRIAQYVRSQFPDAAAVGAASREELRNMADNKGGSDLDVFEGLAKKSARPASPGLAPPPGSSLPRKATLIGGIMPLGPLPPVAAPPPPPAPAAPASLKPGSLPPAAPPPKSSTLSGVAPPPPPPKSSTLSGVAPPPSLSLAQPPPPPPSLAQPPAPPPPPASAAQPPPPPPASATLAAVAVAPPPPPPVPMQTLAAPTPPPARPSAMLPAVTAPPVRSSSDPAPAATGAPLPPPTIKPLLPPVLPPPPGAAAPVADQPVQAAVAAVDMDWDDEEESTHVYDKVDAPTPNPMRPGPAAGTPAAPRVGAAAALLASSGGAARAALPPPGMVNNVPSVAPPPPPVPAMPSVPPPAPFMPSQEATAIRPRPVVNAPAPGSGGSKAGVILGGLALVVVLALAVITLMPKKGTFKIDIKAKNGQSVDRVMIFIDGQKRCDASPCVVADLEPGPKIIKVTSPDFPGGEPVLESVEAGKEKVVFITVDTGGGGPGPAPVASGGLLSGIKIAGNPAVKVSVDGVDKGPLPLDLSLPAGLHKLKFDGGERYEKQEQSVELAQNQSKDLGSVKLKVLKGSVTLDLVSGGAVVVLWRQPQSGKRIEKKLPDQLWKNPPVKLDVDPSEGWRLLATKKGLQDFTDELSFDDGLAEKTIHIQLVDQSAAAAPPTNVASTNGAAVTNNAQASTQGSQAGNASRQAPAPAPTAAPVESAAATAPASGTGTLNMNSIPVSKVVLDGKPLGSTPKMGVSVPAGSHTVTFIHPDLGKQSVTVQVKAGDTKTAAVKFKQPS